MERKVYVDFQDGFGFFDISSYVKYDTLEITTRACSDNFHYAQNEARFSVIYESSLYSKLRTATKDIIVRIVDVYDEVLITTENDFFITTENGFYLARETGGFIPLFYGRITPTKSRTFNGKLDNTMWQLEAVDDTRVLDVKVGDVCWRNYQIMNPANASASIVHQLGYIAGLTDAQIDQTITISTTLNAFAPPSPEETITDVLDALLFEYGYVLNFNTEGKLSPLKWLIESNNVAYQFDDSNIVKEVRIQDSIKNYDGVEVVWYELSEATTTSGLTDILLYRDNNLPYAENGGFSGYPIPSGFFYPPATNVIDPTTSGNQIVYQEYDDSALKYWTNEAIVNRLDYNYRAFKSDYSDIVATSGWRLDWRGDSNVQLVTSQFFNRKARLVFQSTSTSGNLLYYANVYGKVLYKSGERKSVKNNVANAKRIDKYVSTFLFDSTNADKFALYLARLHDVGNILYTFDSEVERYVGEVVNVVLTEGTSQRAYIVEKTFDEYREMWNYRARSFANDIGALSSQSSSLAPAVRSSAPVRKYIGAFSGLR